MKMQRNTIGLMLLSLVLVLSAACAPTRTKESPGEYLDDTVLTSKVKTRLIQDQALKAFQIDVETFRGDVLLSGFVDSKEQAQRAIELAKSVPGVKSVKNSLIVKKEKSG